MYVDVQSTKVAWAHPEYNGNVKVKYSKQIREDL
jgi:hypothetical protein|tara:strand:- start:764 stop:865 length:102 start_codon:yes stop_codon:yes gene_type:complete